MFTFNFQHHFFIGRKCIADYMIHRQTCFHFVSPEKVRIHRYLPGEGFVISVKSFQQFRFYGLWGNVRINLCVPRGVAEFTFVYEPDIQRFPLRIDAELSRTKKFFLFFTFSAISQYGLHEALYFPHNFLHSSVPPASK